MRYQLGRRSPCSCRVRRGWQDLAQDPARRRLLALSLWGCGRGYLNIGAASGCACATNAAGDLHVLTSSVPEGKIWHTIRRADGSWPYPFGDVEAATSNIGVNFGHLACATNVAGDLHVLAGRPYLPYPP